MTKGNIRMVKSKAGSIVKKSNKTFSRALIGEVTKHSLCNMSLKSKNVHEIFAR